MSARDDATRLKGKLDHVARERGEIEKAIRERDDCQSRIPGLEEVYRARQEQLDAFERGIIPPDDADIERLMGLAERWKAHGRACAGMECPELECTSARRYLQALFDAEAALEDMVRRLRAARDDARRHFHALRAAGTQPSPSGSLGKITGRATTPVRRWKRFFSKSRTSTAR